MIASACVTKGKFPIMTIDERKLAGLDIQGGIYHIAGASLFTQLETAQFEHGGTDWPETSWTLVVSATATFLWNRYNILEAARLS